MPSTSSVGNVTINKNLQAINALSKYGRLPLN